MLARRSKIRVATGVLILLTAAVWVWQLPERAKVQVMSVIHANEGEAPQPGWFMVTNPSVAEVLCIPMSIQARAATGWVNIMTMSATNDPFTYDFRFFPFDRVLTQQMTFYFKPKEAVSNGTWRVTVRCTEKTSGDRLSDRLNIWLWKHFPRNSVLAKTYSGHSYELSSSTP